MEHFARGLSASWFATLVTVLYGLASVPLALHFLRIEEFGLFVLIAQIATYFALIEIGMTGATARLLIEYKDNKECTSYGSIILNAVLVFAIQGGIILALGMFGAQSIVALMSVDKTLADDAVYLFRWTVACFAFASVFKVCGSILYANQRLDLLSAAAAAGILGGLGAMACVFIFRGGLQAMAYVFVVQTVLTVFLQLISCIKLRLFPRRFAWSKPSMAHFKSMIFFAKDVFLINASSQILDASQLIIVGKTMGLTAAAIWSVGTKLFALLYQLLIRIEGTAIVFLSEMIVRGENEALRARFRQVVQISGALACTSLLVAAGVNGLFVSIWAGPELAWPLPLSIAMALVVLINVVTKCHIDLVLHSRQLFGLSYVYLSEAIVFVALALFLGQKLGFYGILLASFICLISMRFWYTSWRVAEYLRIPLREVLWTWTKRPLLAWFLLVPCVLLSNLICQLFPGAWMQLFVAFICVALPATLVLQAVALPRELVCELSAYMHPKLTAAFGRLRIFR